MTVGNLVPQLEQVYMPTLRSVMPRSPLAGSTMTEKDLVGRLSLFPHLGQFGISVSVRLECVKALLLSYRFQFGDRGPECHSGEGWHVGVLGHLVQDADCVRCPHCDALLLILEHHE